MSVGRRVRRSRLALSGVVASVVLTTAACQGADPGGGASTGPSEPVSGAPGSPSAGGPGEPTELVFAVHGTPAETAPFAKVVDAYNAVATGTEVTLRTYRDRSQLLDTLDGPDEPDLYLASRRDLDAIVAAGENYPLLELLDERGVDYGDGYSRDALLSFSIDDDLQCMPYGLDPTVVYYNTDLINFAEMRQRGLPVPSTSLRAWSFEAFAAAARVATRPRRGTRGVHVDPTLQGLAPFVYSGAGTLFDDESQPTSLDLESDAARSALTSALGLLRNPRVTLTERQLERRTPLEWFERGRLGMITGGRALVPELREVEGFNFDVMPMPVIVDQVTVGDVSGLCLSGTTADRGRAADFLVYLIGAPAVAAVTQAGYLVPANLEVALSQEFVQPDQLPANANVFNTSVQDLKVSALTHAGSDLATAVAPEISELFTAPLLDDLELRTEQIDEISRGVLDPTAQPSEGPTTGGAATSPAALDASSAAGSGSS